MLNGGNNTVLLRRIASWITLIIKLGGVAIAANEALFIDPPRDPVVLAVGAFMMAGATGLDNILEKFIGNGEKMRNAST